MATNISDNGLNIIGSSDGTKLTTPLTIEVTGASGNYIVLPSANGTRFKLTISNTGVISATSGGTF
jgi:hypothetical protein